MVCFSDDKDFIEEFRNSFNIEVITITEKLESWELAFLEFLILAKKCKQIYGTPNSSFAEEAGLFYGKHHYNKILE